MALQFQGAPDWLLQDYFNRRNPIEQVAQGAQGVLGSYMQLEGQQKTQQQAAFGNYLKLLETDPQLLNTPIGQQLQKQVGGGLGGYQPPSVSTPTTPSPVQSPMQGTAGLTPPGGQTVTSPIVAHFNSLYGRGKLGEKIQGQLKTGMEMQGLVTRNGPKQYVTREQLAQQNNTLQPGQELLPNDPSDRQDEQNKRFAQSQAATLRGQFMKDSEKYQTLSSAYSGIVSQAKNPSPAGDIGLIYQLIKMWDPQTGVKEGEIALPASAGNVPTKLVAQYNKAVKGERFTPEQRKDFIKQANNLYRSATDNQKRIESNYTQQAAMIPGVSDYFKPLDYSVPIWEPEEGLAIGTVQDGFRFKGGNPADQNAWEKI